MNYTEGSLRTQLNLGTLYPSEVPVPGTGTGLARRCPLFAPFHSLEEEGDEEIVPTFPCHSSTLWNISVSSRALSRLCLIIEGTWRLL